MVDPGMLKFLVCSRILTVLQGCSNSVIGALDECDSATVLLNECDSVTVLLQECDIPTEGGVHKTPCNSSRLRV